MVGHYSGSSYTFQAAFWYSSWESFLVNQKNLENSGPMNSDQKRMWDISGNHKDEITTFLGCTRASKGIASKTFTIAK